MSKEETVPQLLMALGDLQAAPDAYPPAPYGVRSMKKGDEQAWEDIIREAFGADESYRSLEEDPAYRPERVWFAVDENDRPVATASCWTTQEYREGCAVLHMVGTLPSCGGKHLGAAAAAAALQQARREGFSRMVLRTDPFRLAAIKTYLRMGFRPVMFHPAHRALWKTILSQPGLERWRDSLDDPDAEEISQIIKKKKGG